VAVSARDVWLRDSKGAYVVVQLDRLSRADRDYVAQRGTGLRSETTGRAEVKGRAYRMPTLAAKNDAPLDRLTRLTTDARLARLTGWQCYGGHCHVSHHHPPVKPCPTPPDSGKRIYQGRWSTFHLVRRDPKPAICGTGAYKFMDHQWCCHEYLQLLRFAAEVPNFWLLYEVASANPPLGITHWLFQNTGFSQHHYHVYYWNGSTFVWYDCAMLRIPE
jgi:hypothetical protein